MLSPDEGAAGPCWPHEWVMEGERAVCSLCGAAPTLWVRRPDNTPDVLYTAQDYQRPYHTSALPNLIMIGPRGSGKSTVMRSDAHMRALSVDRFRYLVMRRTMPELKRSHLVDVGHEMARLGGNWHITDSVASYPNGSIGVYGHCDTQADSMKYLSAQYDLVIIDEWTTFPGELILRISACARVPKDSGRIAMLRGGTNKLGVGAEFVKKYFVDKDVVAEENPDYFPDDYGVIEHAFEDNMALDTVQYKRRLQAQPAHVRKAWLDNEWVIEGAYFTDFRPFIDGEPWHVITDVPMVNGLSIFSQPWLSVYRAIDWGYHPDPAVCLWIAVLPNKRAIVFKERTWKSTLAADVARDIKRESAGMRITETFADPTMLMLDGKGAYSIGDIFEQSGVPLTPCVNKRDLYGYAIHNYLNTLIDGKPQLQMLAESGGYGCPKLIKSLPFLRIDPNDGNKIADGDDHWAVALAYFCMSGAAPTQNPAVSTVPAWMRPKTARRNLYVS